MWFIYFLIAFIVIALIGFFKWFITADNNDYNKGAIGERSAYKILCRLFDDDLIFRNIKTIDKGNGINYDIDIIALHRSGIYVFEVKNYANNATIYFSNVKSMIQVNYSRNYKRSIREFMYNPIFQNNGHLKFLNNNGVPYNIMKSIIVIINGNYKADYITQNNNFKIADHSDLYVTVKSMMNNSNVILSDYDILKYKCIINNKPVPLPMSNNVPTKNILPVNNIVVDNTFDEYKGDFSELLNSLNDSSINNHSS